MGKTKGDCVFNADWLKHDDYKLWIKQGSTVYKARCKFCPTQKELDLKNMGKSALDSHMKTKMHINSMQLAKGLGGNPSLFKIYKKPVDKTTNNIEKIQPHGSLSKELHTLNDDGNLPVNASVELPENTKKLSNVTLENYVTKDDVTRAEIIFSLCQVKKQASLRCYAEISNCIDLMFPDSMIAKKFQMQKDKMSYVVHYGLGPYFQEELANKIRNSDFFAISFDESLNKVAQKCQMDLIVRFWNDEKLDTRYLTSCFLDGATAVDILTAFLAALNKFGIDIKKMIHISMDGPNTNLKFLKDLQVYLSENGLDEVKLIETGTCSLHVVNGSYKTALSKIGWEINTFLRNIYNLFKDFPSRRGLYTRITNSPDFPLKFCSIRWTENSKVMERAVKTIPNIKKYVIACAKKPPNSKVYLSVKEFLKDSFLEVKLGFLQSISKDLEHFLTIYQTNKPMLPFMHSDLYTMLKSLYSRIIKPEYLKVSNANQLLQIDLENKNILCSPSKVNIGFSARNSLLNLTEKESDVLLFKMNCQQIILTMCKKLKEKCPLSFPFVRGATSLSPFVMLKPEIAVKRVELLLDELVKLHHISSNRAESIKKLYEEFIFNENVIKKLEKFDRKKDSLDIFLMQLCADNKASNILKTFLQRVLVVFHGNAAVERSFSFNKEFLVENLEEESLVAQRSVHDFLMSVDDIRKIDINKNMLTAFRQASAKRVHALQEKKKEEDPSTKRKKEIQKNIQDLKLKKQKALETVDLTLQDVQNYEKDIKKLESSKNK